MSDVAVLALAGVWVVTAPLVTMLILLIHRNAAFYRGLWEEAEADVDALIVFADGLVARQEAAQAGMKAPS